jgi:hypothetical protein
MRARLVVAAAFAAGLACAWLTLSLAHGSAQAAVRSHAKSVVLSLGDRFTVEHAPVGCRITRLSGYGGRVFVDCRRAGPLAGSYGTLLSDRQAMIVRFRDAGTAKVVFQARHAGVASRCQ